MKLKKSLSIILSISMIICSTLPSIANTNDSSINLSSNSQIIEQLNEDLGEEIATDSDIVTLIDGDNSSSLDIINSEPENDENLSTESEISETLTDEEIATSSYIEDELLISNDDEVEAITKPSISSPSEVLSVENVKRATISTVDENQFGVGETYTLPYNWFEYNANNINRYSINRITIQKGGAEPSGASMSWEIAGPNLKGYLLNDRDIVVYTPNSLNIIKLGNSNNNISYYSRPDHDFRGIFEGFYFLESITGLDQLDTSDTTNFDYLFSGTQLQTLDLSSFNTENALSMIGMFSNSRCPGQRIINISSFNTNNVTNMSGMFAYSRIRDVNLSSLNTNNVTNMSCMFEGLNNLITLDVNSFDTSNVETMHGMFRHCSSLETLDLSSFDTSNVIEMGQMFYNCNRLQNITFGPNFTTTNVRNNDEYKGVYDGILIQGMSQMFYNCLALNSLDLSNFTINNDTDCLQMLYNLVSLRFLTISDSVSNHIDTILDNGDWKNTTTGTIYNYTNGRVTIPHNTSGEYEKVRDTSPKIYWYYSNNTLHFSGDSSDTGFSANQYINELKMGFYDLYPWWNTISGEEDIHKIVFDGDYTITGNSMAEWFSGYEHLTEIDLAKLNTTNVTDMTMLFLNCSSLTTINLNSFDTSNVTSMPDMFEGCDSLMSLDLSSFNTNNVTDMTFMFQGCDSLTTIYASELFVTSNAPDSDDLFLDCTSLVGGNGTHYSYVHTGPEYARIDTAENPGYFTYKAAPAPTPPPTPPAPPTPEKTINSISIVTVPSIINYTAGNVLNPEGLVIKLMYSDNSTENITYNDSTKNSFTFNPSLTTSLTTNITRVAVTYGEKNTYFDITVSSSGGGSYRPSGGGGGGGGGGGAKLPTNGLNPFSTPTTTQISTTKTTPTPINGDLSAWETDPITGKSKLNTVTANGEIVPVANGFFQISQTVNQDINGVSTPISTSSTYYFDVTGNMVTGWIQTVDLKWYFFENAKTADEGKMQIGWKQVQGSWYYFGSDGAMYQSTVTPDGFTVDGNGVWVQT